MTLKIIADENMPYAREAFGRLGEVELIHGRAIERERLEGASLLFVRSITKIDARLLAGTGVRFVGTATAGTDHVDEPWLASQGIRFASAPGSNANSVAEYMAAAWLHLAAKNGFELRGKSVGIVGVGQVGSRVEAKARALGMIPLLNDPPKARESGEAKYLPLQALLNCNIVTCHTPLTHGGLDPTYHLIGGSFFERLKPGAIFCNAGRGEVVETEALERAIDSGRLGGVILDVWENEPRIGAEILRKTDIGTPHIAGYAFDGKALGTYMVYRAACEFLGAAPDWDWKAAMPAPQPAEITVDARGKREEQALREAVERAYPIERDDRALRATARMAPDERGAEFDRLRKQYPLRREFDAAPLRVDGASPALAAAFAGLGFRIIG